MLCKSLVPWTWAQVLQLGMIRSQVAIYTRPKRNIYNQDKAIYPFINWHPVSLISLSPSRSLTLYCWEKLSIQSHNTEGGLLVTLQSVDVSQITARGIFRLTHVYLKNQFQPKQFSHPPNTPNRHKNISRKSADYRAILPAEETVRLPTHPMICGRAKAVVLQLLLLKTRNWTLLLQLKKHFSLPLPP